MVLLKQKATRKGYEDYTDMFLAWRHDNSLFVVRVRPVFGCHNKMLLAHAIEMAPGDSFEKYI